ncbi:ulp1 protease family, C-terminal catalytic domain-containing protein [Artemisia annua]|uniref:Ulp1 protease family, C-terminal catalytic domain-containing protein n=1 Tax=Artemisia annua TaxID=35608 RepID=A0A2U1LZT0_ARTAN|nr:ulp1 protease family, C-terminal catalytic domain-containing protein [Artemisia annua]
MIEGKMKSEKKQIEAFHESMESEFKKDETAMAMQHIEWAFFPIIAHHHYYLVVFNLFKGTSIIIDNSISGATYDSKYKHVCDLLKNLFSKHLKRYKHPKASDVRDKKTTIMKLKWGTKNNEVDCGVFVMMHMENYNGETATKWNLGFPTEEENQTIDLIKMRIKYATKMLMHEVYKNRAMMSEKAHQFAREYIDKDEKQKMIKENIKKKKAEQDAQNVASAV